MTDEFYTNNIWYDVIMHTSLHLVSWHHLLRMFSHSFLCIPEIIQLFRENIEYLTRELIGEGVESSVHFIQNFPLTFIMLVSYVFINFIIDSEFAHSLLACVVEHWYLASWTSSVRWIHRLVKISKSRYTS